MGENPAALLYRDERFLDSDEPLPSPRLWTFDTQSGVPVALAMPALDAFAPQDGWDIDALRRGADGYWYFRAVRKNAAQPELRMFRCLVGDGVGEQVSLGAFQSSALPEPLSAAPLREMLAALFDAGGYAAAAVVSPEFPSGRVFALDRESPAVASFYRSEDSRSVLLAAHQRGDAVYIEQRPPLVPSVRRFFLPPLPEGFYYTGIALTGNVIVASWEEQDGYSIGAAGFMVIKL